MSIAEPALRQPSLYEAHCRPGWGARFRALGLDVEYVRAEKDTLWTSDSSGPSRQVLDLVGGFGAGLFGHNHPALHSEANRLLSSYTPMHAQGSLRGSAGELAAALSARLGGDYVCLFSNTGAEVVESALKHACVETGASVFRAVAGAFHGKTTGAIVLGSHGTEQFASLGPQVIVSNGGAPAPTGKDGSRIGGIFFEPIRGEGGVLPLSVDDAQAMVAEAKNAGVPLIADEIQTGMGRTGTFLACEQLGVSPDYVCLSKALGGGLAKIGALLVARDRYQSEFSLTHTSTFAEDEWGCALALRALRLLDEENLLARCAEAGAYLLEVLAQVMQRFPEEIRDVRGRGLMIGVELPDKLDSASPVIRTLAQQDLLGWFAAAYFLNVHDIRLLPTLGSPRTLRIQPSAFVTRAEVDRFVDALATYCAAMQRFDLRNLLGFINGMSSPADRTPVQATVVRRPPAVGTPRVAFVGHLLTATDASLVEPELDGLPSTDIERFLAVGAEILGPMVLDQRNVESLRGTAHLTFLGLPITAAQIADKRDDEAALARLRADIRRAAKLAEELGCEVLGLGGYTSALMGNGLRLRSSPLSITSGNNLTVAMSMAALDRAVSEVGLDPGQLTIGVCGALGSIGTVCSLLAAERARELVLIVRNARSSRVRGLLDAIRGVAGDLGVRVSDDFHQLRDCEVVLGATAAGDSLVLAGHLGPTARVLCDIAKPGDFSPLIGVERPEIRIVDAGVVRLPLDESFRISGIPLPPGNMFACMAETILLGMEPGLREIATRLNAGTVRAMAAAAQAHGFDFVRDA